MSGNRLLILGGGFGGLDVARAIGRSRAARGTWDTLLIDKENFFQFNPLLPAVAVGAVETRHIVYPLRAMARHRHIRFFKNKVRRIDLDAPRGAPAQRPASSSRDTLVIALGSIDGRLRGAGAEAHTLPFKTIVDAMTLRARVVELFEMAEQAETHAQRRRLLSFVIVGGGVTGVEVAAELHRDGARDTAASKYPELHPSHLSVTLLEGGGSPRARRARPDHSRYVRALPRAAGRGLVLGRAWCASRTSGVHLADGTHHRGLHDPLDGGRAAAGPRSRAAARSHARTGACWSTTSCRRSRPTAGPGRGHSRDRRLGRGAPPGRLVPSAARETAVAMGARVGDNLVRRATGRPIRPFTFHNPGYIISLGKHSSVVELFGVPLSGRLAWLLWAGGLSRQDGGVRKQFEVGLDHLTHLVFEHDSSQILNRRRCSPTRN